MSDLNSRLSDLLHAGQQETLRKHIIALARYQGSDEDPLRDAYMDVHDPAGQRVLLAVFASARQLNEAAYYQQHSALADEGTTEEEAQAQIQWAHSSKDKMLDSVVDQILEGVPKYIDIPLGKFVSGDSRWASSAAEGLAGVTTFVATIRELCGGEGVPSAPGLERKP